MMRLSIGNHGSAIRRVLCIGAHCDDIEIGCGGTILSWAATNPDLHVEWVVLSSDPTREAEARRSAAVFLEGVAGSNVVVEQFRNGFFPYVGAQIKEYFESLKEAPAPDVIFTHRREDRHQDHRTVCELTWNTFRNHLILEYEIPKYDGDLGLPNVYSAITHDVCQKKEETITSVFQSQGDKAWLTADTFRSLARIRGVECNAPCGLAEAFYGHKLLI